VKTRPILLISLKRSGLVSRKYVRIYIKIFSDYRQQSRDKRNRQF
jgi:hypothetical protein